jgi:hypothetical protein
VTHLAGVLAAPAAAAVHMAGMDQHLMVLLLMIAAEGQIGRRFLHHQQQPPGQFGTS